MVLSNQFVLNRTKYMYRKETITVPHSTKSKCYTSHHCFQNLVILMSLSNSEYNEIGALTYDILPGILYRHVVLGMG